LAQLVVDFPRDLLALLLAGFLDMDGILTQLGVLGVEFLQTHADKEEKRHP
jgi:hypothetical protein